MPDREKVLKALECCKLIHEDCGDCSYNGFQNCYDALLDDAIALLQEQEAVDPITTGYVREISEDYYAQVFQCGKCYEHFPVTKSKIKFCPNCGRKVDWVD